MNKTSSVDSLAAAARFEALFGGTEAGIALWGKRGKNPILGLDFSTTILSWSITGEMSVTTGNNYSIPDMERSVLFPLDSLDLVFKTMGNKPVVRFCTGFMRMFDLLDIDDRVMVVGEFYFNQIGDEGNVFEKLPIKEQVNFITELPDTSSIKQQAGMLLQNAFEFNSLSKYYGAFFITLSKFIVSDMTLQLNGLINFNHGCAMVTTGISAFFRACLMMITRSLRPFDQAVLM